ncbi:MAG: hypothetical protein Q8M03_03125 [Legionella sp.]|nr:hypothetical protein [Legionella sp.]
MTDTTIEVIEDDFFKSDLERQEEKPAESERVSFRNKIIRSFNTPTKKIAKFLEDLPEKHLNYIEPFKTLAKIAVFLQYVLIAALVIPLIPPAIVLVVFLYGLAFVNLIKSFLFDQITGYQYMIEKVNYTTNKSEQAGKEYFEAVRSLFIQNNPDEKEKCIKMSHLDLETYANRPGNAQNKIIELQKLETVKKEASFHISDTTKLILRAKALFHTLLKPLPQGIFSKIASIAIIKPFQLLAGTFLLATTIGLLTLAALDKIVLISGATLVWGVQIGALLLINLPLLLIDAFKFCIPAKNPEEPLLGKAQEKEEEEDFSSSHSSMLKRMPAEKSVPALEVSDNASSNGLRLHKSASESSLLDTTEVDSNKKSSFGESPF